MADSSSNVNVSITADGTQASAALSELDARLAALEASFAAASGAAVSHGAAQNEAAAGVERTGVAAEVAGKEVATLGAQLGSATAAGELFGVSLGEASGKVVAFREVMEGLESSMGPVLIGLLAIQGVMAAGEWLKDGVSAASAMQSEMRTLQASVESQHGSWETASEDIEKFVKQSALAVGATSEQILPVLNDLVTMGNSVHDSLLIAGVAEELSVSKHISLREATDDLKAAELGRYRGLEALDGAVKTVVNRHGDYSDILRQVHKDSEGAVADNHDLSTELARLEARLAAAAEVIGLKLIPMLTGMAQVAIGLPETFAKMGEGLGDVFKGVGEIVTNTAKSIADFAHMMSRMGVGDLAGAQKSYNDFAGDQADSSGFELIAAGGSIKNNPVENGKAAVDKAVKEMMDELNKRVEDGITGPGRHFADKPEKVTKEKATPSVSETYTDLDPYIEKSNAAADAQAKLVERLKDLNTTLDADRNAVKDAMTVHDEATAKAKLEADTLAELTSKHKLLNDAIYAESAAAPGLQAAHAVAIANYQSLQGAVSEFNAAMTSQSTPATTEQNNALAELKARAGLAKTAIADTAAALAENTKNLTTNTDAQHANAAAIANLGNAAADAARKLDAANIAAQKSWDDFSATSAAKMQEDLAEFGRTNAQKYSDYSAMLVAMGATTVENEKEKERLYGLEVSAYQGALNDQRKALDDQLKEQKKAYADYVDAVNAYTNNLIDDIVFKHESMGNILKDVFGDIEKNFVKMLEKQLESTTAFQQVTQSNLPGSAGASGGGALGLFGTILGATTGIGGASGTNPTGSSASPFYVINADSSSLQLGKLTGLPAGIDPGSVTAISNSSQSSNAATLLTNNAANSASALAGVAPMGSTAWAYSNDQANVLGGNSAPLGGSSEGTAVVTSQLSKLIAGAIQGAEFGGLAASITGGSSAGGGVGGALGGIAGTLLHANPLIGAGIDLFGGIIGGLFGGPKANAHDNPDQFNPDYGTGVGYGQFTANWQGAPGSFGGTNFNPVAKYFTGLGGTSEEQTLLKSIQATLAPNSGAAPVLLQEAAALKALERGDTASNALNIVGEKQGMYTLQSGAQVPVQQFMQMVSQYMTNAGGAGASVPVFSISRSYPNENAAHMSADGTMPSGGVTLSNGSHITATNGASNNMLGNTINLTVNGSVVGQNGMQALADIISTNLARAGKTSPVASTQSVYGRTGAGY